MSLIASDRARSIFVVCLFLLPTLAYLSLTDVPDWVKLFPDDAFYYLQIAWNTANAGVISFDGVNPTNGFHPLQWVFLAMVALGKSKLLMMQVSIIQNALLVVLSALVIVEHVLAERPFNLRLVAVAVLCLPFWHVYLWLDAGMEIGFVLFVGSLFFLAWYKASLGGFQSDRLNIEWGALSGFLVLARLDMVIPLTIFFGFFLATVWNARVLRPRILYPIATAGVIFAPYLLWNFSVFGHWIPVSAVVKAGSTIDLHANWRALTSGNAIGAMLAFVPLLLNVLALCLVWKKPARVALLALLLSQLVWYAYMLFIARQVFRWYLAFPYVAQNINLAFVLQACLDRPWLRKLAMRRVALILILVAALIGQAGLYWGSTKISTSSYYLYDVAKDINHRLNETDVVATFDAGTIGFFAEPRVINLDGLVNSYQYAEEFLRRGRFTEYFAEQKITHLLARQSALAENPRNGTLEFTGDHRLAFSRDQLLATYKNPRQFDLVLLSMSTQDK